MNLKIIGELIANNLINLFVLKTIEKPNGFQDSLRYHLHTRTTYNFIGFIMPRLLNNNYKILNTTCVLHKSKDIFNCKNHTIKIENPGLIALLLLCYPGVTIKINSEQIKDTIIAINAVREQINNFIIQKKIDIILPEIIRFKEGFYSIDNKAINNQIETNFL